jgi:DNA-binding MarR family transcriptional regulator
MANDMLSELRQSKPFPAPEEELYLSLIRTADMLQRQVNDLLKAAGISHAQYNVPRILRGAGGDGLPCGEIGARMVTRDPDVTRLLDRLVQRGQVERGRGAGDRRVVSARITAEGLSVLERLDGPIVELHKAQFGFLKEEATRLIEELERVRSHLARG